MRKNFFKKIFSFIFVFALAIFSFSAISLNRNFDGRANAETSTSVSAGTTLSGASKNLYDFLVPKIEGVANGEIQNTTFSVNKSTLESWGVKASWTNTELGKSSITTDDIQDAFFAQFNLSSIVRSLLHDLPYEFYWFDKTAGYGSSFMAEGNTKIINITEYLVYFEVTNDYKPSTYDEENPSVDTAKTALTASILTNAKAIVETNKTLSDYKKLLAYKNTICDLVSYNDDAADNDYTGGYGNPWQVIYVFDNNPLTNVVCEGYAKAFQLLCNLSNFENASVKCYTVTGEMAGGTGSGGHMWNIVTMDDGLNYIVDITNSDTGSVGQNGELFMAGNSSGNISAGYSFNLSPSISFAYDIETKTMWGTTENSILNLALSSYEEDHPIISVSATSFVYDKTEITTGLAGSGTFDVSFDFEDGIWLESNYNWSHSWHTDNNGKAGALLSNPPTNAGTYWLKIVAINKTDSTDKVLLTEKIIISPKTLTISSAVISGRVYNQTTTVSVSSFVISGVLDGDSVSVLTDSAVATLASADVGTYSSVNLSNLKLSGEDKNNYTISSTANDVLTNQISITKATISTTETFQVVTGEGVTLADVEIEILAKGPADENVSGSFIWIDDEGNELDSSTVVTKWTIYKYRFIPDDLNYETQEGEIALWVDIETEFNLIKFIKDNASKFAFGAAIVAAIFIGVARHKRRKRRREEAV